MIREGNLLWKEGKKLEQGRIRIKDIAEELGVSTATVSNVIHGKTHKISDQTVYKVQEQLEKSGYIPNMAAVLLAQNTSRIVCVVLSDDIKYEGKMMEDPFVSGILNGLSKELSKSDYFMMVKEEANLNEIVRYASMWNMAGLILIGYCLQDYKEIRNKMHIPFVVIDSYQKNVHNFSDVGIDNMDGGLQAGRYLIEKGHTKIMYLADNKQACDYDRYLGLVKAFWEKNIAYSENHYKLVARNVERRQEDYKILFSELSNYTAAFCASDVYAIEFMKYLMSLGIKIPEDFSIVGFDNIPLAKAVYPELTTISQNVYDRAKIAVALLQELIEGKAARTVILPVSIVVRDSVNKLK
ncbi:MAG: LacI family DNA-binding transcriptional regulator [Velocimicrobium sp.]